MRATTRGHRGVRRGWRRMVALVAGPVALGALATVPVTAGPADAQAAAACDVAFSANQWNDGNGGFTASVTITNLGDPIDGWTLSFDLPSGAQLTEGWAAIWNQSGPSVTAEDMDWNAVITTGGQTSVGFNGTGYAGDPDQFVLNGTICDGDPGDGDPGDGDPGDGDPGDGDPGDGDPGDDDPGVPIGFGAATTGGAGGATITVSSTDAFLSAIQSSEPLRVQVDGTITLSGMNRVASDKTIEGVGTSGRLVGGGLNIRRVDNVIVRNLTITGSNDDNINIDESTNVWIDHNDLSNAADGALDIKHAADFVTVSWNHFHDQDKNMLLGHSDNNAAEDVGHLRVTYHHNWFDGTKQRNPRVRFGNPVHVFNNYYNDNGGYGVASTMDAGVLVEANFFENVGDPFHLGEGSSGPGSLVARDNHFVNSATGEAGGSVAPIPYSYTADPAPDVKAIVTAGAGVRSAPGN